MLNSSLLLTTQLPVRSTKMCRGKGRVHLNGFIRLTIGSASLPHMCILLGLGLIKKGDEGKEGGMNRTKKAQN